MVEETQAAPTLTDEEIRAAIEVEQVATMWGQEHTITPRFVEEKLGDGLQWIWLSPIMHRPNYWVVRVDSAFGQEQGTNELCDSLDEIYEAIEREYGSPSDDDPDVTDAPEFPYIRINDGSCWGPYDFERKVRR